MTATVPPKYKFLLAPSTANDPPDNVVWTQDDVIGISPPMVNVHQLTDPFDFGAKGDGVTDDTLAFQDWLDAIAGRAGYGAPGVFALADTVKISSNTTIFGAGKGSFIITKMPGFPSSHVLFENKNIEVFPTPQADKNIQIYGTCFQGLSGVPSSAELVSLVGVHTFVFRDCLFEHNRNYLLAFSNTTGAMIDNNEFTDFGRLDGNGGQAIWGNAQNTETQITNNFIHDGQWCGILVNAIHAIVAKNRIRQVKECGITGGPTYSNVSGNVIDGVALRSILGNGIMLSGGYGVNIEDNTIINTDQCSIHLTDMAVTNCNNNVCNLPNQLNAISPGTTGTITLIQVAANGVDTVNICNNICSSADGKGRYGISLYNFGAGGPMLNVSIIDNNLGPMSRWSGSPMFIDANVRGPNFVQRGNSESVDCDVSAVNFIIAAATAAGAFVTVGGVGFKPRTIQFITICPEAPGTALSSSIGFLSNAIGWSVAGGIPTTPRFFGSSGIGWSTDAGGSSNADTSGRSCISIFDGTGAVICQAGVIELTDDGFTLLVNNGVGDGPTTLPVIVTAICSP